MDIKQKKRLWWILGVMFVCLSVVLGLFLFRQFGRYGFARPVSEKEQQVRMKMVDQATQWLGMQEGSSGMEDLVAIYNGHEPLAQGYAMTVDDNWCAAFGSVIAIQCGYTDRIPTECGCQRQIGLWQEMGRWEENDHYIPLPGDYIYYAWDEGWDFGDCTGWADHVGIVVGTAGPFIKVIEGNYDDQVKYRTIMIGNYQIRGYGLPDYSAE